MEAGSLKWDARFMRLVGEVASWSKDPAHRVGAIVVSPDGKRVSWGYNGLPSYMDDDRIILDDAMLKNDLTVHAERNAIKNAGGRDISAWHMFVTRHPCDRCAADIVDAGIARVTCPPPDAGESGWKSSQERAAELLVRYGVRCDYLTEEGT